MPLLENRPVVLVPQPPALLPDTKVFVIRFTNEIFLSYEEYLDRLEFYRQKQFQCAESGKRHLTYEEAIANEEKTRESIRLGFPEECYPSLLSILHYSTKNLQAITTEIFQVLKPFCKEKKVKCPLKQVIKNLIKHVANREKWNGAPWIVSQEYLSKYKVNKAVPREVAAILNERARQREKKRKLTAVSASASTSVALSDDISSVTLKYPCEDLLLVMYRKLDDYEMNTFDDYFQNITRIGCFPNAVTAEDNVHDTLVRFNQLYTSSDSTKQDMDTYLRLNKLFANVWKIWSFCDVFSLPIHLQQFPVTYLMDALLHDKKCLLLEEVQRVLLDMIRENTIAKWNPEHETSLRRSRRNRGQPRKIVIDEDTESEKDSGDESESEDETDTESEFDSVADVPMVTQHEQHPVFDDSPMVIFRYDVLKDYIQYLHTKKINKQMQALAISSPKKNDKPGDGDTEMKDVTEPQMNGHVSGGKEEMDEDSEEESEEEVAEEQDELMESDYVMLDSLNETIMHAIHSARSYYALSLECKLFILEMLMEQALRTEKMGTLVQFQLDERKQALKQISEQESALSAWTKEERAKLKKSRQTINEKKQELRKMEAIIDSFKTKDLEHEDKENVNSAPTSKSGSTDEDKDVIMNGMNGNHKITSRVQQMQRNKTVEEYDKIQNEYYDMDDQYKRDRESMTDKEAKKKAELESNKFEILKNCRVRMAPIGEDRFFRQYFWSDFTNGRIFIYSPFSMFPSQTSYFQCKEHPLLGSVHIQSNIDDFIAKRPAKRRKLNSEAAIQNGLGGKTHFSALTDLAITAQCVNPWDVASLDVKLAVPETVNHGSACPTPPSVGFQSSDIFPCWAYISSTTEFHELLRVLDHRGDRESKLLFTLESLKENIKESMRKEGRDDYEPSAELLANGEIEAPLRRSKRSKTLSNKNIPTHRRFLKYQNKFVIR